MKTIKNTKSKYVKKLNLKDKIKKTKPVSKKTSNKKTIRLSHKDHYITIEAALKELAGPMNPSINLTASSFGISETTLRHAVEKGLPKCFDPGTVLSKHEEEQLVGYCKNMQKLEFGLMKSGMNHCMMEIDHPDLFFQMPQVLTEAHAQRANPTIIKDHFDKLGKIIEEYSLTPDCIWNIDETGFIITPKVQKVLMTKERVDLLSLSYPHSSQPSFSFSSYSNQQNSSSTSSSLQPNFVISLLITHKYATRCKTESLKANFISLEKKIEILKKENELLKQKYKLISEELETFKTSNTCSLKIAFKKIFLFVKLLINEDFLQKLKEPEELTRMKVKNVKRKKEADAQKWEDVN
ncbi:15088_t:CDS:2 [Cetraspora pellucida]|uniref:15088_t:CDS:1 n=1 Tax=Cetraspora pellucida TaxID=1433469 RepID=A0A9N9CQ30_9GLOM|nr:15088_t:CDS:2 [Cetraspora pellucida]